MIMLWTNFPWNKIYMRILLIQKKIFQATKEYNKSKIYKLQKYLLNSNEVKLLSINHVVQSIESYYCDHNIQLINNQQKFFLVKLLFYPYLSSSNNLYYIVQQIHKYIIYLCIKPEWEAKLDFTFKQAFNFYIYIILNIKYIKNKSIFNNFFIKNQKINSHFIDNKYSNITCIINKMQSFQYINNCIKYWSVNDYFIDSIQKDLKADKYSLLNRVNYLSNSLYLLRSLLYKINIIGYFWYLTYYKKLNNQKNIIKDSILFNNNLFIVDEIRLYIKTQYLNNSKYRYNNIKNLLLKVTNLLKLYYSDYLSYINYLNMNYTYKLYLFINIKIFYHIRKYKNIIINNYYFNNINKSINTFLYIFKYINYFKYKI